MARKTLAPGKDDPGVGVATAAMPWREPQRPEPFVGMFPSGMVWKWRMPDPFTLVAFNGPIPDPTTAAVIELLNQEKAAKAETDPKKWLYDAQAIRGMYGLWGAMAVEPRFDPSVEYGDGKEVLGRREIGMMDVVHGYWLFRLGTRHPSEASSDADDAGGVENASSNGDAVRETAK